MTWMEWYNSLAKPTWTPAPATISLIWMILYPIILISFGFVFVQAFRGKVGWKIAMPFAINLIANLLFMPIFAGLRSVPLAAADIVIVWATILWCAFAVWPHLPVGRRGPGAIFRMGVHRHGPATVDHGDELGEAMIRLGLCCIFRDQPIKFVTTTATAIGQDETARRPGEVEPALHGERRRLARCPSILRRQRHRLLSHQQPDSPDQDASDMRIRGR